jgi:hypothetical protein
MANPWIKKNPLLSMWLSGVNTVAGSVRGHAMSELQRQQAKMISDATRQVTQFWTGAALMQPAPRRPAQSKVAARKRKRRSGA